MKWESGWFRAEGRTSEEISTDLDAILALPRTRV